MSEADLTKRLDRIEKAMGELSSNPGNLKGVNSALSKASKKFVANPSLESAQTFLNELDVVSKRAPTARAAAWTTVTVTVVTILSDDQG